MTLREALLESNNAAAVLLQQRVGTRPVLRLAKDLGVTEQPDVPSLALGSGLVSPLDLTAAFAVFPNLGYRVRPRGMVVGGERRRLHRASRAHRAREDSLGAGVVSDGDDAAGRRRARHGRGGPQRRASEGPVGGKTGTTSENRDAWFVGFNSSVVVGVWVGFDQPQKIFEGASGSRVALPIWADFMRRTARRLPAAAFEPPDQLRREHICLLSYHRALDGCPTYVEYFKDGDDVPSQLCPIHSGQPAAARRACGARAGRRDRPEHSRHLSVTPCGSPAVNRCWWCGTDPLYVEYHDDGMGKAGHRRPASLREGVPRRIPGRTELADDSAEARELPARVRRLRHRPGRALHGARRHPPAWRRGHRQASRQDRIDDQQRAARHRAARGVRLAVELFLAMAAGSGDAAAADHARGSDGDGDVTRVHRAQQGPAKARMDVRRADDHLRLHAGDGPGQRSRRRLRLQRSESSTDCRTRRNASSYALASFCGATPMK